MAKKKKKFTFKKEKSGLLVKTPKWVTHYCCIKKYTDMGLEVLNISDYNDPSKKLKEPKFKNMKDMTGCPDLEKSEATIQHYASQPDMFCVVKKTCDKPKKDAKKNKKNVKKAIIKPAQKCCRLCKKYYHKCHLVCAGNHTCNPARHEATYTMGNCCPLNYNFNTGVLKAVENRFRDLATLSTPAFFEKHVLTVVENLA